ncbi:MarR family EPS-associated transcriptional regulator [Pandoraea sp. XJJ-1]|uniref:MarR family EPS-associated transcriptional regulator n=1 Tax=Pandoraea sp. XJJ-1 TaxID=3002643 RepID=UPI002280A1B1|nr:MarR family EPS-associated transcriptional regulator [Pandoraea sp. XJJ-1]WAL82715.1 MarR family EPS-associated transcriptional regulator [Pandoraea sp. XJJ-1]
MDEIHYRILRLLAENPTISQRELARVLGVSLGKANYCLRGLLGRSWVKVQNFRNSENKRAYAYLLTPAGIEAKAKLTLSYLSRKQEEYEAMRREIDALQEEIDASGKLGAKAPL